MLNNIRRSQNLHADVIQKCRHNDRAAQFEIYKLYYKSMFNTCFRMVSNTAEAEDIMQESFLSAFQKINSYNGDVSFGAWLKRIVINKSIDTLRARKMNIEELDENNEQIDDNNLEDENETDVELVEKIKKAINLLPDGYRIVITLYLIEGYDHEEIAQILDINESSSRSQLVRAKKKIYDLLKNK